MGRPIKTLAVGGKERMTKRKRAAIVVLSLVIVSVLVLLITPADRFGVAGRDAIAVVRVAGPIEESGGLSLLAGAAITPGLVAERLEQAEDDPSVKALVVRISSPGGSVAASQEIAAMFDDFSKPLVVSLGDVATSGGYYVAARADRIVAQPGTLTGSIGVIWTQIDPEDLLDELGIEIDAITAGEHKDMFLPGRLTPQRRRIVKEIVDDAYRQFVDNVAQGRDMTEGSVEEIATGQPFTGAQSLELGLVDRLGGEAEAVHVAQELGGVEDVTVKVLSPSFFERLFSGSSLSSNRGINVPATGPFDARVFLLRDVLRGLNGPRYEMR